MSKKKTTKRRRATLAVLQQKTEIVKWRVTPKQKNRLKWAAKTYAGGNVSAWLEYVTENYSPKFLSK